MSQFAIAGLQLALKDGENLDFIVSEIRAVKQRFPWVDMVVLSELATYGTNRRYAQPIESDSEGIYCELAQKLGIWLVPGSVYIKDGEQVFNSVPVISPTGLVVDRYSKMFPFTPYESGISPGSHFCVFDIPNIGRFGISICYDKWFPETTRALAWLGAEVIICPTLTTTLDRDVELAMTRSSAATNQLYFVDISTAAPFGYGRSIVCDPGGQIVHEAASGQEVFAIEIDLDYVKRIRDRGWHGLGQTMKSFRDSSLDFPQYARPKTLPPWLDELGDIKIPAAHQDDN